MGYESTFLFATPSLWEGMARLVDFGDSLSQYNVSQDEQVADLRAIMADWKAVGADLRVALDAFGRTLESEQPSLFSDLGVADTLRTA